VPKRCLGVAFSNIAPVSNPQHCPVMSTSSSVARKGKRCMRLGGYFFLTQLNTTCNRQVPSPWLALPAMGDVLHLPWRHEQDGCIADHCHEVGKSRSIMDFYIGFNIRRLETFPNNTLKPGTDFCEIRHRSQIFGRIDVTSVLECML
jgi:hypothetical protein